MAHRYGFSHRFALREAAVPLPLPLHRVRYPAALADQGIPTRSALEQRCPQRLPAQRAPKRAIPSHRQEHAGERADASLLRAHHAALHVVDSHRGHDAQQRHDPECP
eukprot:3509911-Prymnesium_polylepis.1